MTNYAVNLEEISSGSIGLLGGKAANLGELIDAGLPVPKAFCVTTDAYKDFIDANSLSSEIFKELEELDYEDVADIEKRAASIRSMITSALMPSDTRSAIQELYAKLESELGADVSVSVRSSATAEDLPGTSFAGQQDTYLGIQGVDAVLDHVQHCWASLWTDRAIAYRHKQGFKHEDVLLAVVIQEMFPSEVSGVMFTANPVTSNPNEIFINTSWGLGEAVVSGLVNPDQYVLDKSSLNITDKVINEKTVMTETREDGRGSEEVGVPSDKRLVETLSVDQLRELANVGLKIEEHYAFHQDIEWGYANGRFAILQSRDVTGADLDFSPQMESWQTKEAMESLYDERWVWSRAYSDEIQTGPSSAFNYGRLESGMTGLKWNMLRLLEIDEFMGFKGDRIRDIPLYRQYGARAYYNLAFEKERIRCFIPPMARDEATLWAFPEEEREEIKNMPFNWPRFLWLMLKLHVTNPNISLIDTPQHCIKNQRSWVAYTNSVMAKLDYEKASFREILATEVKARGDSEFGDNVTLPFTIYLYFLPQTLKYICEEAFDDKDGRIYNNLYAGQHTKTSEENIAVWELSRCIRKHSKLKDFVVEEEDFEKILPALDRFEGGAEFKELFSQFLEIYGHRGGAERDPYHYRWYQKPSQVFYSIKPMLALDDEHDPAKLEEEIHQRMLATKEQCLNDLRKRRLGYVLAAAFNWFVNLVQEYIYYRDYERFYNDEEYGRPRDYLVFVARKFIERGLMTEEEDIFFFTQFEILDIEDGKLSAKQIAKMVEARRRVYERYSEKEPPKYLRGWKAFDDNALADDGEGFRAIAASSGVVTGRARVCRKLNEISKIEKGDILVTVSTDPGWTTIFSIIGGVVIEAGGVVAHAVMISREYGLPCVASLTDACNLIPDGAMITVDGGSGRVLIHDQDQEMSSVNF